MNLIRKIAFYLFIAISIAAAIWAYMRLKESKEPRAEVAEHIPENVACVIQTKTCSDLVSKLTRQNLIWNSLLSNSSIQVAQNGIRFLDSLVNSNPEISEVISGNSVYWSFFEKDKLTEHVVLFKVKEKNNEELFNDFFSRVFLKDESVSSFKAYYFTNNKQKWIVCYKSGIVYISSDLGVLQNCMELDKKESLAQNKRYIQLLKENGEQNTQIYFNHNYTPVLSKTFFNQQSLFGVDVQLSNITFTGYSYTDTLSWFESFKNQQASTLNSFNVLPDNADIVQGISISDGEKFYANLNKLLSPEKVVLNKIGWQAASDTALYNMRTESYENIDGQIGSATYVLSNISSRILSINIKEEDKAEYLLKIISDSALTSTDLSFYKINDKFSWIFSFNNDDFKNMYASLVNQKLLFFSNKEVLNYFIQCYEGSKFLSKNAEFMDYANDNLDLECNYFYYENAELSKKHNLNSIISSEEIWMSENVTSQLSLTAKNNRDNVQVRINASHAQPQSVNGNNSKGVLWTFSADSSVQTPAYIFTNHLTQENEICFQDNSQQLYLINSTGNLIWKKKIDEPIRSEIYTVDIFKNGKFQMLFNSDNYLYLIDRNGNYVQGFPVKLPAKATSKLILLDYESNKDYRLFLACADKRIYNFNLYGIKTEGFVPVKTDAVVTLPVNYVRVGPSDYLITADVEGKIYAFSRRGEGRIDFKNKTIEDLEHLFILPGNTIENTKLVYLDDKNNLLNKISLGDKKEASKIGDELNGFKTSFALVNDDTQKDLLVYGNGAFYAYDLFTNKLVEYFNEQSVFENAQLVQTSNQDLFVLFDKASQRVDVIGMDAKLIFSINETSQAPLMSNLYKNGKTYLLAATANKLSCQELK